MCSRKKKRLSISEAARFALETFEPRGQWSKPKGGLPVDMRSVGHELIKGSRAARARARQGSMFGCLVLMYFQGGIVGVYFDGKRIDGYSYEFGHAAL